MRLSFVNGGHGDIVVTSGGVNLGSADGNDVVLDGKDVSPWHARILVDARGIVLQVLDPAAQTHVNARPVREKAILRCGDMIHLGHSAVSVKADDDLLETRLPARGAVDSANAARVVLRGLSGANAGRAIAVGARAVVGSDRAADVVVDDDRLAQHHAAVEIIGDGIWLRGIAEGARTLVNGVDAHDARLFPGDQVVFARHHFVVEAPGLVYRAELDAVPEDMHAASAQTEDASGDAGSGIWWLIGVAALIAAGLYLLIHRGF